MLCFVAELPDAWTVELGYRGLVRSDHIPGVYDMYSLDTPGHIAVAWICCYGVDLLSGLCDASVLSSNGSDSK